MNGGKIVSGIVALAIYLSIIFLVLFFYNIHQTKAKNYVEKNADRVTVTLVNSDKTVFNKSAKVSTPKKPVPLVVPPIPKKTTVKKVKPHKVIPKKITPKPKRVVPKKKIPKKVVPKKVVPKKVIPKKPKKTTPKPLKKVVPKKVVPKKVVPKKVVPKKPKKKIPKKVVPKKPKKHPKKSAKDLFSSIKTKRPTKKVPKERPRPVHREQQSSIRHNSSITDRIKATHQSGRVSNANRERGVENAYIAKVKQRMNNWNAVGMRGEWVTINLTIFQSGKFRYTASGVNGVMRDSLTQYMRTLNRMGLGRHSKSTPYSIQVRFRVN